MPWLWKWRRYNNSAGEVRLRRASADDALPILSQRLRDLEARHERALLAVEITLADLIARRQAGNSDYESRLQALAGRLREIEKRLHEQGIP